MSGNLLDSISNVDLLVKSWKKISSGKSFRSKSASKGYDNVSILDFESSFDSNIKNISNKLINNRYNMSPLFGYTLKKSSGKGYRLITVPTVSDRIIHRAILTVISPYFTDITDNGVSYSGNASIKKRYRNNYLSAFRQLQKNIYNKNFYIFESDIKSFFDKIIKNKLYKRVIERLPDTSINSLIKEIIYFSLGNREEILLKNKVNIPNNTQGLSQGSPLSPLFANIYLGDFDKEMKNRYAYNYIRYVDDFIVSTDSKNNAEKIEKFSKKYLKKIGLELADGIKTQTCNLLDNRQFIYFLGLKISKYGITCKSNLKDILNKVDKEYLDYSKYKKTSKIGNIQIIDKINSRILGFVNYYKYFHTTDILRRINKLILMKKRMYPYYNNLNNVSETNIYQLFTELEWQEMFKSC